MQNIVGLQTLFLSIHLRTLTLLQEDVLIVKVTVCTQTTGGGAVTTSDASTQTQPSAATDATTQTCRGEGIILIWLLE